MAIVRWDPLAMMRWPSVWDDQDWDSNTTVNAMDIFETENEVVVRAHIPGIDEANVELTFEKGILWIQAQQEEEDTQNKKYYRKATRSFSYKVAVPGNVDYKQDPDATIDHGVVTVSFKKAEEAKPKKIEVKPKAK